MVLTIRTAKRVFAIGKAEDYTFEVTKAREPETNSPVYLLTAKKPGVSYELYAFRSAKDAGNTFSSIVAAMASDIPMYTIEDTAHGACNASCMPSADKG